MKIGIVGCGNIGRFLAGEIQKEPRFNLVALADVDQNRAKEFAGSLKKPPMVVSNEQVIELADIIVEAATPKIVPSLVEKACSLNKDLLIISVGGMLNLSSGALDILVKSKSKIYLPTGALAGIDAIKAAVGDEIYSITLTTRKPPEGLLGAPYLATAGIDLTKIDSPTIIFEGSARDAVKGFPQNVNVAATLSLAGIGDTRTQVRIIADPQSKTNSHEIEAIGKFGKMTCRTENVPFPQNPKTSYLAALSALATLKKLVSSIQVGT